ncbi:3-isopropylmalate dehydrogenase [Flavobacteriaceae bacterium F89]|uniref:3-isopropylmalate dehydrogenase n=1 Tax=Cerina litoralis TaxID=2874477 RepID=A0AAE3JRD7_9FLAO|nr:3-isopropylmalate dehydrogenase [Cerina litoralis]MCG2459542.1 3-isopropylmalate dehydrogenase [Cerina litoralis]
MELKIALLPGDGIGPEVMAQAVKCLQAVEETFGHNFIFSEAPVGAIAIAKTGNPLPDETLQLCRDSNAVLFGTVGSPEYDKDPYAKLRPEQGLLQLRKKLGLFANIKPIKAFSILDRKSPLKKEIITGTDFIIYRELTGGIYFGEKQLSTDGTTASDLCVYSESEIGRIAHLAFKSAKSRNNKLTLVDKANVLETSRLWRRVVSKIAESYPEVALEFMYVDNAGMQIILNPTQFDVVLTENLLGDIISDVAGVICGSIGLLSSASVGENHAMFEPVHGSYSQAAGKNMANPVACILSAALLLEHFGLNEEARAVQMAVYQSLRKNIVTPDLNLKTKYGTDQVGDFIANNITDTDDNLSMNNENIGLGKSTII